MKLTERHLEGLVDAVKPLNLTVQQAEGLFAAILRLPGWDLAFPISAEALAFDAAPLVRPEALARAHDAKRSRHRASQVQRTLGVHEHADPPVHAFERRRLTGVLLQIARKNGWTLRQFTTDDGRMFYSFWTPETAPATAKGRPGPSKPVPGWVQEALDTPSVGGA